MEGTKDKMDCEKECPCYCIRIPEWSLHPHGTSVLNWSFETGCSATPPSPPSIPVPPRGTFIRCFHFSLKHSSKGSTRLCFTTLWLVMSPTPCSNKVQKHWGEKVEQVQVPISPKECKHYELHMCANKLKNKKWQFSIYIVYHIYYIIYLMDT